MAAATLDIAAADHELVDGIVIGALLDDQEDLLEVDDYGSTACWCASSASWNGTRRGRRSGRRERRPNTSTTKRYDPARQSQFVDCHTTHVAGAFFVAARR
jgi:hypothetical protein